MTQSSKPKKQRKRFFCAPLHSRKDALSVHLSKPLQKELGCRNVPVRKGDTVKVMRGTHKGKSGKVTEVRRKKHTVIIAGISRKKSDGKEVGIPIHASNTLATELDRTDDRRRIARKGDAKKKDAPKAGAANPKSPKKGE